MRPEKWLTGSQLDEYLRDASPEVTIAHLHETDHHLIVSINWAVGCDEQVLREFEAVLEGERKVLEEAQGERREVWHHSRRRMGGKILPML